MTFAGLPVPIAAALAGAGAVALTALYLLRRRVTRVVVPFVSLWHSAGRDAAARRLGRRLRRWLSLALLLVILGLIALGAADPQPASDGRNGRTMVLLIDRSASMQALDEPGSRLARARAQACAIIDGLGPRDRMMVASFAGDVTAATGIEGDHARLRAAVDAIAPSDEPGDPRGALAFSAAVLRGRVRPTLIFISDAAGVDSSVVGAGAGAAAADALRGIDLQFVSVGRRRDNLAIVAFSARRLPGDPSSVELGLVAQSFRGTSSDVTLVITAGPARIPVARRALRLGAGARAVERLSGVALPDGRLEAVLEGAHDDLPLDDRAFAVVPEAAPLRVLTVGGPNLYLEGALLGLAGTIKVAHVPPDAIETTRAQWSGYDAVIFDGVTPNPAPLVGRFLYLDPHGPGSPWPDHGTVADPIVTDVARDHALVKQISLADLNIGSARRLTAGKDDVVIASAPRAPLILAHARPDAPLRRVAVAFDPRRSDLPLRPAFPLFLANALDWLANQPMTEALSWPTGRTVRVEVSPPDAMPAASASAHAHLIRVVSPDGAITLTPIVAGGVTLALNRVGFYDVVEANGRVVARVAANLASPAESDVAPGGMSRFASWQPPATGGDGTTRRHREPWVVVLLAALVLCTCEWLTFHRRLTV